MEDPLCDSSFGSMVTLDYVTPDTGDVTSSVTKRKLVSQKKLSAMSTTRVVENCLPGHHSLSLQNWRWSQKHPEKWWGQPLVAGITNVAVHRGK